MSLNTTYLGRLIAHEGNIEQASNVLRWLKRASACHTELDAMITQYTEQHKPLAYILGSQPFGPLDLIMRPPVLIPRSETGEWVTQLATDITQHTRNMHDRAGKPFRILDIGTGSGCIPLLLSVRLPPKSANILSVDIDHIALELAAENLDKHRAQLKNPINFERHDLFSPNFLQAYKNAFDLIVSNPPYISQKEYEELDPSVLKWESITALNGSRENQSGLRYYERIAALSSQLLARSPLNPSMPACVLEIGASQAKAVKQIFGLAASEYASVIVEKDHSGRERVVKAYRRS